MQLSKIDDHRDCLEKATRWELFKFAEARGVTEIDQMMPAILMRQILRAKNITNIETQFPLLQRRTIGQQRGVNATKLADPTVNVVQVDAAQELARQWQAQQAHERQGTSYDPAASGYEKQGRKAAPKTENPMAALRAECKRRGIKISRTSKMEDLRAMLDGENTSQRGQ